MRFLILCFSFLISIPPVFAQNVTELPICTQIINEADYTVRGTILTATADYDDPSDSLKDGTSARHTANFKLAPGEKMDVCSQGPFYEGQRLDLQLRTLIPIFECRTALTGPITIQSEIDADGQRKTWATCY